MSNKDACERGTCQFTPSIENEETFVKSEWKQKKIRKTVTITSLPFDVSRPSDRNRIDIWYQRHPLHFFFTCFVITDFQWCRIKLGCQLQLRKPLQSWLMFVSKCIGTLFEVFATLLGAPARSVLNFKPSLSRTKGYPIRPEIENSWYSTRLPRISTRSYLSVKLSVFGATWPYNWTVVR